MFPDSLLVEAGFRTITIRPTVKVLRFPSAEAFVQRYVAGASSLLAQMVAQADDQARAAVLRDVRLALQAYRDAEGLALPKASHLVTAHV
jgi:hypothetical protein